MHWFIVEGSRKPKLHGKGCKYLFPSKNHPNVTFRRAKKKEIETHEKCKVCVKRLNL